jgi:hypothetical protein
MEDEVKSVKVSRIEGDSLPYDWFNTPGEFWFPINQWQMDNLVGRVLTHIEAMNLPENVLKANKDLVKQSLWGWYGDVQENSLTSYQGCIAPIRVHDQVSANQGQHPVPVQ